MNLREKYAADRALADLKRETRLEKAALKDYWRGVLLPAATRLAAFVIGCLVLGHWVIVPFREAKMDRPQPYYAASSYYMEGDLTRAAESLREDLESRGPVRVSEVESEQKEMLKIVRRLVDEGQIVLAGGGDEQLV
mgnify:CR=1 FL=1